MAGIFVLEFPRNLPDLGTIPVPQVEEAKLLPD
jgi:hypothetical protein